MYIEYAAHVDHGIAHSSDLGRIGLTLLGAVIGIAIVGSGVGALAIIGAASTGASIGMNFGDILDNFMPQSIQGKIITGHDPVVLGKAQKPAARAHEDTQVDCHSGNHVVEGSLIVMLGKQRAPMSRRQDRTQCSGFIAEKIDSILIGGDPSHKGEDWDEEDSNIVQGLNLAITLSGIFTSAAKGAIVDTTVQVAGLALDETDHGDAASVLRMVNSFRSPAGNLAEGVDQAFTVNSGVEGVDNLIGQ